MEKDKKGVVEAFREKTEECFHKIGNYTPGMIEDIVVEAVKRKLEYKGINEQDITIVDLVLSGSRSRGFEREDSDLDVVLEFKSDTWREYSLFDLLHESELRINGILVDINPISEGKSGTLEEYLVGAENYLTEKEKKENKKLVDKMNEVNLINGCSVWIFGDMICFPAEYDFDLSDHEQRRLKEIIQKNLKDKKKEERKQGLDEKITGVKERSGTSDDSKKLHRKGPEREWERMSVF